MTRNEKQLPWLCSLWEAVLRRGTCISVILLHFVLSLSPTAAGFDRAVLLRQEEEEEERRRKAAKRRVSILFAVGQGCCSPWRGHAIKHFHGLKNLPYSHSLDMICDTASDQPVLACQHGCNQDESSSVLPQKAKPVSSDEEEEGLDPDMAAMMGFGGFGGSAK